MATKSKLKSKRVFLEPAKESDSYYHLHNSDGWVSVKFADCARSISWDFGRSGEKRAKAKIAVLKNLVDEVYNYLHEIEDDD